MSGRTLVLGDVHGAYQALTQVFDRADVGPEDQIIFLGDVVDGWPETDKCIDFLISASKATQNFVHLLGNHDEWVLNWFEDPGWRKPIWVQQGGMATIKSYGQWSMIPDEHKQFLRNARLYFEKDGRLFVHADFVPGVPVNRQAKRTLIWERRLAQKVLQGYVGNEDERFVPEYDEVYVGHTATTSAHTTEPVNGSNVWVVDTGAGWYGRLTLMDVETKEFWQSDPVKELYPEAEGR